MTAMGKLSLQSLFCDALAQVDNGNFTVTFWDGAVCTFGQGNDFKLHFKTREALKRVLVDAPLGFGEGYMHGDIEVEGDLKQVVSIGLILKNTSRIGLNFIDCENMRMHYSKTLDYWEERFEKNEPLIRAMFDDRFIRMWRFYLAGCSASFRVGTIHLFQLLFSAGVRNDLPLTREWMVKDYPA